jgi:hypothetical protein
MLLGMGRESPSDSGWCPEGPFPSSERLLCSLLPERRRTAGFTGYPGEKLAPPGMAVAREEPSRNAGTVLLLVVLWFLIMPRLRRSLQNPTTEARHYSADLTTG